MNLAMKVKKSQAKYVCFGEINGKWTLVGTTCDPVLAGLWDKDPQRDVYLCKRIEIESIIEETVALHAIPETQSDVKQIIRDFIRRCE